MDLQDFCSDETRMAICTPFVRDGWKYATDGRICVRILTTEPDDSNEPYKRPDASALFKGFNVDGLEPFEIPTIKGVKIIECDSCNGDGYAICDMGHEHECNDCDGDGHYEEWPKNEVGGQTFSERYLSKIINLPGLQFFARSADMETLKPAFFTFDNGQGLLMPIRKEKP
jgi:hypothetical protein